MSHIIYTLSSSKNLSLYRGDTLDIKISCDEIPFLDRDNLGVERCLYLGVMEPNQDFEYALIRKRVNYSDLNFDSEGNTTVTINPYETELLAEGLYYYQFKFYKNIITSEGNNEEVRSLGKHKLVIM